METLFGRDVSRWNWRELRDIRLDQQSGKCAICGVEINTLCKKASLDHDHTNGKVRGVLCFRCNGGLGHFKDDATTLLKAIQYLNKWSKQSGIAFVHDKNPDSKTRLFNTPHVHGQVV